MSEWVSVEEKMPPSDGQAFYIGKLTDEHMRMASGRLHPYDVVTGWYLNNFKRIYTHWQPIDPPA